MFPICISTISITIYALLCSMAQGSEYYVKSDPSSSYRCNDNNNTCHIYCDEPQHANINAYRCGNAVDCHFHCDETQCGASATLFGDNAANLYVTQNNNGEECFKGATVYTPNNGNAYFSTNSLKGFKSMTVKSGSNSKEIVINCTSSQQQQDDCQEMNVDAESAEYLHITIGNQLQFTSATVQCPLNSKYSTSNTAPCVIDATDGIMQDILIVAPDGIPKGVHVSDCHLCDATVRIQCHNIDTVNPLSAYPFTKDSECWCTNAPTIDPTVNPTAIPTLNPTESTSNPTHPPSINPTINPSVFTLNPTITPTDLPSMSPTQTHAHVTETPSKQPSSSPTNVPSKTASTLSVTQTSNTGYKKLAPIYDKGHNETADIMVALIGIIGVCCVVMVYVCWKRNKHKNIEIIRLSKVHWRFSQTKRPSNQNTKLGMVPTNSKRLSNIVEEDESRSNCDENNPQINSTIDNDHVIKKDVKNVPILNNNISYITVTNENNEERSFWTMEAQIGSYNRYLSTSVSSEQKDVLQMEHNISDTFDVDSSEQVTTMNAEDEFEEDKKVAKTEDTQPPTAQLIKDEDDEKGTVLRTVL